MRSLLLSILLSGAALSASAQSKFSVSVKFKPGTASKAFIEYEDTNRQIFVTDTVNIKNGSFVYNGDYGRPVIVSVSLLGKNDEELGLPAMFYPAEKQSIDFTAEGVKVNGGGVEQEEWQEYLNLMEEFNKSNKESEEGQDISKMKGVIASFIKKHPDSYVSFDLFRGWFAGAIQPKEFIPVFETLGDRFKQSKEAKAWLEEVKIAEKFAIGKLAEDFTQNDINGNPVNLSSFKGKYVLLDFWASWCVPCRETHPALRQAYAKYKDKNFKVLGVSMDSKKDKWLEAIAEDSLVWPQLSDLKGGDNAVGKIYGVTSIPRNFLIDPNGVIVAINLEGDQLDQKLNELLK